MLNGHTVLSQGACAPQMNLAAMQEGFELGREINGIVRTTAPQQTVEMVHVQDGGRAGLVSGAQRGEYRTQTLLGEVAPPPLVRLAHMPLKRLRQRRIALEVLEAIRLRIAR